MKVCQKAGCTRGSRRKQMTQWEHESVFGARSGVKEELSIYVCACGTLYVLV
jgi:hypothetical protein